MRRAAMRECEDDEGKKVKRINYIADKLLKSAMEGKMDAIKEVGERLDGKAPQAVMHEGTGENGEIIFKTILEK